MRLLLVVFATCTPAIASPAQVEGEQVLIERAIAHRICYEVFWRGDNAFRQGKRMQINFLAAKAKAYAWGGEFSQDSFPPANKKLFAIGIQGDRSLVTRYFYSFDWNDPWSARYAQRIMREMPTTVRTVEFQIPSDCMPKFDPSTRWKEEAIAKIVKIVERETRRMARTGDPDTVQADIGDFNFDYPQTEVYIPRFKKLLYVTLRDEEHLPKDLSILNGLAVKQEENEQLTQEFGEKVQKFGITRTIRWGGGQP